MKTIRTMTMIFTATGLSALIFSSCAPTDPEYAAWKKKKQEEAAAANNPYGAPAGNNPYGVPQAGGETGSYTPSPDNAPYQPLPGVNQPVPPNNPNIPADPGAPAAGNISHTVVSGDSLWGLARKYNTTIEAIQAANNLTSTTIRTGQTLVIPGR